MSGIWVRRTAVASVLLVALVAAVCSYAHMQNLAARSGEEWRSTIIPLSVDGMLVASTLAIVDRRRAGLPAGFVPWLGLSLGILASLAANVAAARPDGIARVIAAWPPLAFAVAVETLVIVLRGRGVGEKVTDNIPANIPAPAPPAPSRPQSSSVARTPDKKSSKRGHGRVALARELGISEYEARRLLEQRAAEKAPRNGHAVLQEAR